MAGLEDEGYITRPHTSAGGIPADKGYRHFVEGLGATSGEPDARDFAAIRTALEKRRRDMEEWADAAASIVAGLLKTLAFASPPKADASRVKQLHLLLLQDLTVMLVLILQETTVVKQLIPLESPTTQDELYRVRNRLRGGVSFDCYRRIVRGTILQADNNQAHSQNYDECVGEFMHGTRKLAQAGAMAPPTWF